MEIDKDCLDMLVKAIRESQKPAEPGPVVTTLCESVGFAGDVARSACKRTKRICSSFVNMFANYK